MQDIIVIGGGPAGLTAALYAARSGCSVLVLEQAALGGQIVYSPLVENYPGLPGMRGAEFADALLAQVEVLGVELRYEAAQSFAPCPEGYQVQAEGGTYTCKALVLALGASHRHLGLEGEEALTGMGVSYCAVCDGPFYKGRHVAVIGGGDTALQDALFLSGICSQVTLIHRRDQFRGEDRLVQQVKNRDNIQLCLGYTPQALLQANGELTGLRLVSTTTGITQDLPVDGAFIAVGQVPGTGPFAQLLDVDEGQYFSSGEDCRTRLPGVFVAGDCRAKAVRQLTTAVGDGATAGLAAAAWAAQ